MNNKDQIELLIPNGYYQLWMILLNDHEISISELGFSDQQKYQIEHILNMPMDGQSSSILFEQVIKQTQSKLAIEHIYFELAKNIKPEHFGLLGYMATRSNSVEEAIRYVMKFSRLVIDGSQVTDMQIFQKEDALYLSWPNTLNMLAFLHELTFACMVELARKIFSFDRQILTGIHFAHEPLASKFIYEKFYGCNVLFCQPRYQFIIDIESLALPSLHSDPMLIQLLTKQAEDAIATKPKYESLKQKVKVAIVEHLKRHEQAPKIEDISLLFNISSRTLQRQLKQNETSFKALLEIERMKMCALFLKQNVPIANIAIKLGYSDQSALTRAFKAYFGQTIMQYKLAL